ncbi:MAG: DUF937 domain-containing protein [Bacteroidia bacterium]
MSLIEQLTKQLSGSALESLAGQLGTDPNTTSSAISAALPMIVGALAKNASTQEGASALDSALSKDHDGSILDNLGGFLSSTDNGAGAGILKHVFGNNQPHVQQGVSQLSGLDVSKVGPLLENLAPIVMGMLGKQKQQQGLDMGGLASILMGARNQAQQSGSPAMDMLGSLLDRDGDGSFLDDVGGFLGKFMK